MEKQTQCYWCSRPLTFVQGKGWLHDDGERTGAYWMRCQDCPL